MPPQESATRFHYLMMALITVMQIGGVIDARMHVFHGFNIDSFFVPAHYVLYGGWFGVLVAVTAYSARRRNAGPRRGTACRRDTPSPRGAPGCSALPGRWTPCGIPCSASS